MTNNEALGYATIATYEVLKRRGFDFEEAKEVIQEIRDEMWWTFDIKDE